MNIYDATSATRQLLTDAAYSEKLARATVAKLTDAELTEARGVNDLAFCEVSEMHESGNPQTREQVLERFHAIVFAEQQKRASEQPEQPEQQRPQLDRETWLTENAQFILDDQLAPLCDIPTTPFRISIGFPSGRPSKVLAQCWKKEASADGVNEIFVSPTVDDSIEILAALTHELIHFTDNCESGHQNHFARVARKVGLEGKLTATVAGADLKQRLQQYVDLLGPIPHAKLDATKSGKKKQGTRMIKVECTCCDFNFRATQTQINKIDFDAAYCPACLNGRIALAV